MQTIWKVNLSVWACRLMLPLFSPPFLFPTSMWLLSFFAGFISSCSLPNTDNTRHAGRSSFFAYHKSSSAHLHICTCESELPMRVVSLTSVAAAAHTSLVRIKCHFSRALAISAVPAVRYCSQQGTAKHVLIGGNGTNPSRQAFLACAVASKVIAQGIGTCTLARVGLLILGIDERVFWVRDWPGWLSR